MEHILQFAVDIDDQTIKERVEEHAYEAVVDKMTEELKDSMFTRGYYSSRHELTNDLREQIIQSVLDKYKNDIIVAAAKEVAGKVMRSKPNRDNLIQAIIEAFNVGK